MSRKKDGLTGKAEAKREEQVRGPPIGRRCYYVILPVGIVSDPLLQAQPSGDVPLYALPVYQSVCFSSFVFLYRVLQSVIPGARIF